MPPSMAPKAEKGDPGPMSGLTGVSVSISCTVTRPFSGAAPSAVALFTVALFSAAKSDG